MSDIVGALLRCDECTHAVTHHDGSGCGYRACGCPKSKEQIVGSHIDLAIAEHQALYRDGTQDVVSNS